MSQQTAPERRAGRPRDGQADEAILRATLELVGAQGITRTTIAAIAARAGVGKATIHRRWPTKSALLLAALSTLVDRSPRPDTGSVRGDLHEYQRHFVAQISGSRRDVLPALVAEAATDPELHDLFVRFVAGRRRTLADLLRRGVERGELRPDLDVELALDLFAGPLVYRVLVAGRPVDAAVAEGLLDLLLDGLAPA
jgi:AcrR family transcriptional regulator